MHVDCVTEGVPDHAGDEEAVVLGHPVCEVDIVVLEETLAQRVGDLLSVGDCVTLVHCEGWAVDEELTVELWEKELVLEIVLVGEPVSIVDWEVEALVLFDPDCDTDSVFVALGECEPERLMDPVGEEEAHCVGDLVSVVEGVLLEL